MKKIILILLFITVSASLFAAYTYTAQIPHPYTGEYYDYTITVNDDLTYTITFFENTRTFTYDDFMDGTYEQWLLDIIEDLYPASTGGSVIQSFSAIASTINNTVANSSTIRTRMLDKVTEDNTDAEEIEKKKMVISIVPDFSYLMFESGSVLHVAAGIAGEQPALNFHIKPWIDYALEGGGMDIGLDLGYTGMGKLGDASDLLIGMGMLLGYYDSILNNIGFSMGFNFMVGAGFYISESTKTSAGLAYNLTIDKTALAHGYAFGMNIISGLTRDLFISAYGSGTASMGGISMNDGMFISGSSLVFDFGGSVAYYISDSFYLEVGGQYITDFDSAGTIGISLGSSYRF